MGSTTGGRRTAVARAARLDTVDVVVVVNHDDLRRGERGSVDLTETIGRRLDRGYLRLADNRDDPDAPALGSRAGNRDPYVPRRGATVDVAGGGDTPQS